MNANPNFTCNKPEAQAKDISVCRKNGTGPSPTARRLSRRPELAKEYAAAIVAGFSGRRSLFLLELDIDDVFGLLGSVAAVGRCRGSWSGSGTSAGAGAGSTGRVEMLGHRLAGAGKLVHGPVDRCDVVRFLGLVDLVDGRPERCLVGIAELVLVLLEQFLELVNALLGGVSRLDQLTLLLVLAGVGLGVPLHLVDLVLAQAAGRFDADGLLLAGTLVAGRDVQDAVGVDVEGDLDLGHAHPGRGNSLEVEVAEEAVVAGHRPFA